MLPPLLLRAPRRGRRGKHRRPHQRQPQWRWHQRRHPHPRPSLPRATRRHPATRSQSTPRCAHRGRRRRHHWHACHRHGRHCRPGTRTPHTVVSTVPLSTCRVHHGVHAAWHRHCPCGGCGAGAAKCRGTHGAAARRRARGQPPPPPAKLPPRHPVCGCGRPSPLLRTRGPQPLRPGSRATQPATQQLQQPRDACWAGCTHLHLHLHLHLHHDRPRLVTLTSTSTGRQQQIPVCCFLCAVSPPRTTAVTAHCTPRPGTPLIHKLSVFLFLAAAEPRATYSQRGGTVSTTLTTPLLYSAAPSSG